MLYKTNNPHGGDIYKEMINMDYSANINPLGTPQRVKDAIRKALPLIHHYPDPYCRRLVRAISEKEEVSEDYILCGNGAAELIYTYCGVVKPRLAVEAVPTFSEYSAAVEINGGTVERYVLCKEKKFEFGNEFLTFIESKKPEIVFLCNPNNPTGQALSKVFIEKILKLCKKNDIRIFADECFLDLSEESTSMKSYLEEYPKLCIIKAFTKSYGMAGVRLGYCMSADKKLLMKMSETVQQWNVSLPAQTAGVAALTETEFLQKSVKLIADERKWLKAELENIGFWVCPSKANYLMFYGQKNLDNELKKRGIAIRNCANFAGLSEGWYRIAVRLHEENEILLDAIRSVCKKR